MPFIFQVCFFIAFSVHVSLKFIVRSDVSLISNDDSPSHVSDPCRLGEPQETNRAATAAARTDPKGSLWSRPHNMITFKNRIIFMLSKSAFD